MARQVAGGRNRQSRPDKPGAQRVLREIRCGKWIFLAGFALALLAIVQSLIKAQQPDCFGHLPSLCGLKLFDPSDALGVFTGLVALFYTRKQILDSQLPYMTYEGNSNPAPALLRPDGDTFGITLKNVGNGSAIVAGVRYHICVHGHLQSDLEYDEVLDQLKRLNLEPEIDFILHSIGTGYALAKDGALRMFEIRQSKWWAVDLLDCDFDFRDVGGRLYRKQVFLIPRDRDRRFPRPV